MLNKIIRFSLQNRLFILMASVLLMIGGSIRLTIRKWMFSPT